MTIDTLVADIERQIGEYLTDCPEATFSLGADRAGAARPARFPDAGRGTRAGPGAGLDL